MSDSRNKVQEILKGDRLPVCPLVLTGLTRALNDPDTTISDLSRILSTDQRLTAKVLKVVNSAYYGLSRAVKSVEEAAFRLGFRELWSLAVAAQINDVFKQVGEMEASGEETLWEHSLRVAIIARRLSSRANSEAPEEMFTAGVLHDIGKLALFCHAPEAYRELLRAEPGAKWGPKLVAREIKLHGVGHAVLGGHLLRHWNIPSQLTDLVERHHNPAWGGRVDPSTAILTSADALAHAAKREGSQEDELLRMDYSDGLLTKEMAEALELDGPECARIATEAMQTYEELIWAFK